MRILPAPPGIFRQTRRHARREFSTSPIVKDAPQTPGLPPARLRALMSLYHNSSTFITPATLSSRIDAAFANSVWDYLSADSAGYPELKTRLEAKRSENKFGTSPRSQYRGVQLDTIGQTQTWSDQQIGRQAQVAAALWGTEVDGKPSVETVLETKIIDEQAAGVYRPDGGPSSKSR